MSLKKHFLYKKIYC